MSDYILVGRRMIFELTFIDVTVLQSGACDNSVVSYVHSPTQYRLVCIIHEQRSLGNKTICEAY